MEESPRPPLTSEASLPLVSIGIPAYNEEAHIRETLASLAALDYPNLECIISDNASTDATATICAEFCREDRRFVLHRSDTNRGAGWNFRHVLDLAHGEFFMWAGAHDRWHPEMVSRCVSVLRGNTDVVTVYPAADFIDDSGTRTQAIQTTFDTTNMPRAIRPAFSLVALSGRYLYPIYGLHRRSSLRELDCMIACYGPDLVQLFHLAFLGETVFLGGYVGMQIRQCADYGNWAAYYRKLYGSTDGLTAKRVARDLRDCLMGVVRRCARRPQARLFYYVTILLFLRYGMPAIRKSLESSR